MNQIICKIVEKLYIYLKVLLILIKNLINNKKTCYKLRKQLYKNLNLF